MLFVCSFVAIREVYNDDISVGLLCALMMKRGLMRLDYLRYFIDVADTLSIKSAAKKNSISPQGMSKAIRGVESDFGFELFNRGSNNIYLTRRGREILPAAKRVVAEYDDMAQQARSLLAKKDKLRLLMYCSTFVFVSGMIGHLRTCMSAMGCDVEYVQMRTDSTIEMLMRSESESEDERRLGIVIFFSSLAHENYDWQNKLREAGLAYRPYLQYSDYLLVSRANPLALRKKQGDSVSCDELRALPVISSSGEQRAALKRYLGDDSISTYIEDLGSRLQLVRNEQGGILVPPFAESWNKEHIGDDFVFLPLSDPYSIELGFVGAKDLLDSRLLLSMIANLNNCYRPFEQQGLCRLIKYGR